VLEKVAGLPISTWRYRGEDPSVRHMGPMAQDFHAAFGLGDSELAISTVDADGVALAAIQGLYQVVREQGGRIAELEAENAALRGRLAELEARVRALEASKGRASSPRGGLLPGLGLLLVGLGLVWARRHSASHPQ